MVTVAKLMVRSGVSAAEAAPPGAAGPPVFRSYSMNTFTSCPARAPACSRWLPRSHRQCHGRCWRHFGTSPSRQQRHSGRLDRQQQQGTVSSRVPDGSCHQSGAAAASREPLLHRARHSWGRRGAPA